jgi:amidase
MRLLPALLAAACLAAACGPETPYDDAGLLALDAPTLADALREGRLSATELTQASLDRIARIDRSGPALNAIIEVNPDALAIASELDSRFAAGGPVGPLHGLPVVLKANIDTADRLATSAGSIALRDHHARADAELVARLREAGAVVLAKSNLSEWANFRSLRSTSGWSSLGGQTRNPYVLDRNPCGSSSGSAVAVAAQLVPLAIGTETNGSIVCPAGANGVVGIKPTLGLISQHGIVPIAASQDTAGPMARTVAGAALLLAAMQDTPPPAGSYDARPADLTRVRLGVVRDYFGAGRDPGFEDAWSAWLDQLRAAGAELIDPVRIERSEEADRAALEVLLFEFHAGIDGYLANAHTDAGSLDELIAFNEVHADRVMPYFGQELLVMAAERGPLDDPAYLEAVETSNVALRDRLATLFAEYRLDALVAPVNSPAWRTDFARGDAFWLSSSSIAAVSGYPSVTVPAGLIDGLPVAIAFIGEPFGEQRLIGFATAFEQLRGPFPRPEFRAGTLR